IYQLAEALGRVQRYTFPVALNTITRGFFEQTAKVETRPAMAAAMRALSQNPDDAAAAAALSRDDRYASMLRTSCVATRLGGGHGAGAGFRRLGVGGWSRGPGGGTRQGGGRRWGGSCSSGGLRSRAKLGGGVRAGRRPDGHPGRASARRLGTPRRSRLLAVG